jgi:predicted nucleotide-binding protein
VRSRYLKDLPIPKFAYSSRHPAGAPHNSDLEYVEEVLEKSPQTLNEQVQQTIANLVQLGERGKWMNLDRDLDLSLAFARDIDEMDMLFRDMQEEGFIKYELTSKALLVQLQGKAWRQVDGSRVVDRVEEDAMSISRKKVFIGHGGSAAWRDLKDFLQDRLNVEYDEFNRESTAGLSTKERLLSMLSDAGFAFLVLTAEDETTDGQRHARQNVIHEAGLFQGRLGFERAIILLDDGCAEFSNIVGLTQIRFPKGSILAKTEEIRRVLEREGIVSR